jgi:hypothetical protein
MMNERIRELTEEAGFEPNYEPDGSISYSQQFEKFAELIVRECIGVIENTININCDNDDEQMGC